MGKPSSVAKTHLNRVSRCAANVDHAQGELRQAMVEAKASGETYRDIAEAAGMSHQRVWQIVAGYEKASKKPQEPR